jgi:ribonuclease D
MGTAPNNGPGPAENRRPGTEGTLGTFPGEGPIDAAHHDLGGDAQLVRTEADLRALREELRAADRVALDLETTALDPREDRARIISLTTERGTWLVDCFEAHPRELWPVLADKELIVHNALFDLGFLFEMGFELKENSRVLDTMLMSQVLEDKENA